MASTGVKQLGVTAPLSTAQPTESEKKYANDLVDELTRQKNFESTADTNKRSVVLLSLQKITEEFVKQVSRTKGLAEPVVNASGGKVFTYGSYRLGVFGPGSDIDTLVVVPAHVSREDYFTYFPDLLIKMAPKGAITDLTPVADAYVPIIKFEYSGISIDLIFSRLIQDQVPLNQTLLDDKVLQGLDDLELRSLNGTRVTDEILTLVPQSAVFRLALRAIKLWAQRRAIYANIMGFPGGVAWAMLVARICQLFPMAVASIIVHRFFRIMESWQWPQPVLLKHLVTYSPGLSARVWNPRIYKGDSFHLMPIITPAYPSMCATHNITRSTKEIIQKELKRGGEISEKIMTGKASWKDLFVKHTFFTQGYKYYLSVITASTSQDAQLKWSGLVESKVRHLVVALEAHQSIAIARPFNKGFERVHKCKTDEQVDKAKSGSLECQVEEEAAEVIETKTENDAGAIVKEETSNGDSKANGDAQSTMVYTMTHYIGLELQPGAKSLDLAGEVDQFKHLCTSWEKYDKQLSALNVVHTRSYDLPDDVFTEGEVKPARPVKKKTNGVAKKRSAPDDANSAPAKRQQTAAAA